MYPLKTACIRLEQYVSIWNSRGATIEGVGGGGRSPAALFCNLKKSDLTLEKNMLKLCSSMG